METSFVILALLLLLIAAVAPGLYALRKRMASGGQVELWRAMQRRGLNPADAAEEPRNLAVALRRCTLCPSVDACHEWLASDARDGLEGFCPNAAYFNRLERS